MAQQIAHSRGHTFDIDSFLAPEQRDEYIALLAEEGASAHTAPSVTEPTEPAELPDADTAAEATDDEFDEPNGRPSKRLRIGPHTPLAQVYWKQRMDRLGLAGHARRSATPGGPSSATPKVKADPDEPGTAAPSPAPTPGGTPSRKDHSAPPRPLTVAERVDIQGSASYW